jgi:hypothetical protein
MLVKGNFAVGKTGTEQRKNKNNVIIKVEHRKQAATITAGFFPEREYLTYGYSFTERMLR